MVLFFNVFGFLILILTTSIANGKIQKPASHDYTNVIMDSTALNNNVHVHDIVHWEIWKNKQSILKHGGY